MISAKVIPYSSSYDSIGAQALQRGIGHPEPSLQHGAIVLAQPGWRPCTTLADSIKPDSQAHLRGSHAITVEAVEKTCSSQVSIAAHLVEPVDGSGRHACLRAALEPLIARLVLQHPGDLCHQLGPMLTPQCVGR